MRGSSDRSALTVRAKRLPKVAGSSRRRSSVEASASMSSTTAADMPIDQHGAGVAAARGPGRAADRDRGVRCTAGPPTVARGRGADGAAAKAPARRRAAAPPGAERSRATPARRRPRRRARRRRPGARRAAAAPPRPPAASLRIASRSPVGTTASAHPPPDRPPRRAARRGRPHRRGPGDGAAREPERAVHRDRRHAPPHVGVRGGAEHDAGGDERDHRERDQQRDDDARRLADQQRDAVAREERDAAHAIGLGARLGQRDVGAAAIVQPQQRAIDRELAVAPGDARGARVPRRRTRAQRWPAGRRRCRAPARSRPRAAGRGAPTSIVEPASRSHSRATPCSTTASARAPRGSTSRPPTIA